MKRLWMEVTKDKYELPITLADTAQELADKCEVNVNTVISSVARLRKGIQKRSRFICVEIDEEKEKK